jgi:hypothetical protein
MIKIQRADEEAKKKSDKAIEIKKLNTQIMMLRSDITKMEDTLKENQMFKIFLDKVTPQVSRTRKVIW